MTKLINVKRSKRGATWSNGEPRMCTTCSIEDKDEDRRRRRRQAVVTADRVNGSRFRLPVAYCEKHVPDDLREEG